MDAHDFICNLFSCRFVSKELADDADYKLLNLDSMVKDPSNDLLGSKFFCAVI